jgi:hypothetical protein
MQITWPIVSARVNTLTFPLNSVPESSQIIQLQLLADQLIHIPDGPLLPTIAKKLSNAALYHVVGW